MEAVYVDEGDVITPTGYAAGPWDPTLQHGGAPAALLARAIEAARPSGAGQVVRVTIELIRPVPLAALKVATRTLRNGRKLQLIEAVLTAEGTQVARATGVRLRSTHLNLPPEAMSTRVASPPGPGTGTAPQPSGTNPYFTGIDTRVVAGSLSAPGPATAWFRLTRPIVAGEEPSPLIRVMAVADFANGISSPLDPRQWSFINADLTVCCHRHPAGEWVALDSQTVLSDTGIGCTLSHLHDTTGPLGWSQQNLLIDRRPTQR